MKRRFLHWLTIFLSGVPAWVLLRAAGLPLSMVAAIVLPAVAFVALLETLPAQHDSRVTLGWAELKQAWRDLRASSNNQ